MRNYVLQSDGRIRAIRSFELSDGQIISEGDIGGRIDGQNNLHQNSPCWVFPDGEVTENACVSGNALIYSGTISGNAKVYGSAVIRQ